MSFLRYVHKRCCLNDQSLRRLFLGEHVHFLMMSATLLYVQYDFIL